MVFNLCKNKKYSTILIVFVISIIFAQSILASSYVSTLYMGGSDWQFSGTTMDYDGFMKDIHIENGRMLVQEDIIGNLPNRGYMKPKNIIAFIQAIM